MPAYKCHLRLIKLSLVNNTGVLQRGLLFFARWCVTLLASTHLDQMNLQPVDFKAVAAKGCFVYAYLREHDLSPYYIGYSERAVRPFESHNVKVPTDSCRIRVMRSGLSQKAALDWEKFFIFWYGRIDEGTGILRNQNPGGSGGSMGAAVNAKISAAKKGVSTLAIRAACKKRGCQRGPMGEDEKAARRAQLAIYSGRPDVIAKRIQTVYEKSYEEVNPPVSFEHWCDLTKQERAYMKRRLEAARFLEMPYEEYLKLSRGERISKTRIKKHELGVLGTKRTGPLSRS